MPHPLPRDFEISGETPVPYPRRVPRLFPGVIRATPRVRGPASGKKGNVMVREIMVRLVGTCPRQCKWVGVNEYEGEAQGIRKVSTQPAIKQ